jgi:hypothetical protein
MPNAEDILKIYSFWIRASILIKMVWTLKEQQDNIVVKKLRIWLKVKDFCQHNLNMFVVEMLLGQEVKFHANI